MENFHENGCDSVKPKRENSATRGGNTNAQLPSGTRWSRQKVGMDGSQWSGPNASTLPRDSNERGQHQQNWIDKPIDDCSHVYSDGTSVNSLFDTRQEKIDAMNMIAILAYSNNVKILVQQVMTTHIHAIVSGMARDRDRFARGLKRRLMLIASKKRHSANSMIMVGNDEIQTERELMNKFMYVYRNAIAAGYMGTPWGYVGGPGDIYFTGHNQTEGNYIDTLSITARREMFHSKVVMPKEWKYNKEGLILPHCYVDWGRVERLFKNPKVFIAFMHQSKGVESAIDMECSREYIRTVSEKELREECKKLCGNMFGKSSMSRSCLEERIAVAQRIWAERQTYSISALSRATLVPQSVLETIFGRK